MLVKQMRSHPQKDRLNKLCFLCLYQIDRFRDFIHKMKLFSRVPLNETEKLKIMENSLTGDEACLAYAFKWLNYALSNSQNTF